MKTTIGIIGGGNMGAAILAGAKKDYSVLVLEKDPVRRKLLKQKFGARMAELSEIISKASVLLLAVKPQDFDSLLEEIRPRFNSKALVVSIAAGIPTSYIEKRLGQKARVVRAMPNLPATVGGGMTGICSGKLATKADLAKAKKIFDSIGKTVVVKEEWMDKITAISGSGPGYVFLVAECLMKAAVNLGMDEALARDLVYQTLKGSVAMLESSKEGAAELRARVTSKGGTTQAAMDVFLSRGMEQIFVDALQAAEKRAGELGKK